MELAAAVQAVAAIERATEVELEIERSAPLTRWEYKTLDRRTLNRMQLEKDLNELGARGWELVSITSSDKTVGLEAVIAVMKRSVPL